METTTEIHLPAYCWLTVMQTLLFSNGQMLIINTAYHL